MVCQKKINMTNITKKNVFLQPQITAGCGAVGSALRSGRRGRKFESSHPDQSKKQSEWIAFFVAMIGIPPFTIFTAEWFGAPKECLGKSRGG